jgi:preprotein translocase subunit YajC
MSFLISDALAEGAAPAAQAPGFEGLLPLIILAFFFVLFVWPQYKRGREQKKMLEALSKGVEVVTSGGILGKVAEVDESFVQLEVADNVFIFVQKHTITTLMPKGTYKSRKKADRLEK